MIRLAYYLENQPPVYTEWDQPIVRVGRSADSDICVTPVNVSSQHGLILLREGRYFYRDNQSTNGSMVHRRGEDLPLTSEAPELELIPGDRILLASMECSLVVDDIDFDDDESEAFDKTILAERATAEQDLEGALGEDFEALRCAVRLARELATCDSVPQIADLSCRLSLEAFPRATRALFLRSEGEAFAVECMRGRDEDSHETPSRVVANRQLIRRCLAESKGYLFRIEKNQMQAIATRVMPLEDLEGGARVQTDCVVLCAPLMHQERCLGFLEIEGPLDAARRSSLTVGDLNLATLMGHMVAARLSDLEQQLERLKLARKATAGFLAATVGHCFKNLLFVPMSLSKMMPLCLKQGNMAEVEWMLARNGVNVQYLNILSNEFAAASKDPTEGFEKSDLKALLESVAGLVNGMAPDRVTATVEPHREPLEIVCHGAGLKRLLMNLTLNAVDALFQTGKDKPEKQGRIVMKTGPGPDADHLSLIVADNGPGIPEGILENLRAIYRQVRASADALGELQTIAEQVQSTKDQGFKEHYGLGFLFVCQTVHQHRGDMTIQVKPGEGTMFQILLPYRGPTGPAAEATAVDGTSGDTNAGDSATKV